MHDPRVPVPGRHRLVDRPLAVVVQNQGIDLVDV
jgi:hypothetical protein